MSPPTFRYLKPTEVPRVPLPERAPADLDPDHHLWKNGRTWWIAFTVHEPGARRQRLRLSLRTRDLARARARRDAILLAYERRKDCRLALRYARRGA